MDSFSTFSFSLSPTKLTKTTSDGFLQSIISILLYSSIRIISRLNMFKVCIHTDQVIFFPEHPIQHSPLPMWFLDFLVPWWGWFPEGKLLDENSHERKGQDAGLGRARSSGDAAIKEVPSQPGDVKRTLKDNTSEIFFLMRGPSFYTHISLCDTPQLTQWLKGLHAESFLPLVMELGQRVTASITVHLWCCPSLI